MYKKNKKMNKLPFLLLDDTEIYKRNMITHEYTKLNITNTNLHFSLHQPPI